MKKLLLFFLLLFSLFIFSPKVSFAQQSLPLNTNSDVQQNFHTYSQSVFIEILASAVCFTSGIDVLSEDGRCLGVDPITKKLGYVTSAPGEGGGLLSLMGGLIGATYNLPASTGTYTHYLANNFGITRTSLAQNDDKDCSSLVNDPLQYGICHNNCSIYIGDPGKLDLCQQGVELNTAKQPGNMPGSSTNPNSFGQGIGFDALTPVLAVWKAFRNLTYLLFVVIFVVLGLGIMFRLNIDARTVMTMQNQIPKIIIALVLITFSYAIAGFLIDVMYLSIYLVVHVFDAQKLATVHDMSNPLNAVSGFGGINKIATPIAESSSSIVTTIFDGTLGGRISKIVIGVMGALLGQKAGGGLGGMIGGLIGGAGAAIFTGGAGAGAGAIIGTGVGKLAGGFIGFGVAATKGPQILEFVASIIVYLIILIAMLAALFRTWIALIKAYVFILLDVIFAPIFIVGGLLPGSSTGGFTSWIRSMLGNLAAFPTVFILFLVGSAVQSQLSKSDAVANFSPPLVGGTIGGNGELIASIIGLGIILIMPESVNLAKQFFKSPERKLAAAALGPVGVATGFINKPIKGVRERFFGEDKLGNPKAGTKWVEKRFGRLIAGPFGGGAHSTKFEDGTRASWLGRATAPGTRGRIARVFRRGNNQQGGGGGQQGGGGGQQGGGGGQQGGGGGQQGGGGGQQGGGGGQQGGGGGQQGGLSTAHSTQRSTTIATGQDLETRIKDETDRRIKAKGYTSDVDKWRIGNEVKDEMTSKSQKPDDDTLAT